jgi:hypothetical protein
MLVLQTEKITKWRNTFTITVLQVVTPYNLVYRYPRFRTTCYLSLRSVLLLVTKSNPRRGLDRPLGFREVVAHRFQDRRHINVVRLSALRTCRLCPREIYLVGYSFLLETEVDPRAIVRPEGLCQWHLRESNPRHILLLVRRSFISVNGITFVNEICLRASLKKQSTFFPQAFTPYRPQYNWKHVERTLSQRCTTHEKKQPIRAKHMYMHYK